MKYSIGQKINGFTITGLACKSRPGYYQIKCKCGEQFSAPPNQLNSRVGCVSCFATRQQYRFKYKPGQQVGQFELLEYSPTSKMWKARHSCGNLTQINPSNAERNCSACWSDRPQGQLPSKERAVTKLYDDYRKNAIRRGLDFQLSKSHFGTSIFLNCFYCDCKPSNTHTIPRKTDNTVNYSGLDRVDNSVGYTDSNTVACCRSCNSSKKDKSLDEWVAHIDKLQRAKEKILQLRARTNDSG